MHRGRPTHQVTNQPPPLQDYNLFDRDRPLAEAIRREGASWAEPQLQALGKTAGTAEVLRWGQEANVHPPVLRTHDRYGHRIDDVEFHPSWHRLMELSISHGIHALPWREPRAGAHVARAAMMIMASEVEAGHGCPVSMTFAAVPTLRVEPEAAAEWEPRLTSLDYDPRLVAPQEKAGALCGMAMTEKQGGSDVRTNTTRAEPVGDGGFVLTGHKWFCSAPMSDAFLVLAQAPAGLTCFLLPRVLPDGTRNAFLIQRLKDKLGNRSNASAEIELDGAWARRVGEEGRGVPTIIEMVNVTRLDCVLGSAGLMRRAVAEATHHSAHRVTFDRLLVDHPLMRSVLADLCVESEAATALALRLARSADEAEAGDRDAAMFRRLGVAVGKYQVCKTAVGVVAEALECLGGNGYVEESGMPRLHRETPLNSIWEGSGNVSALDVVRAITTRPDSLDVYLAEVEEAAGADRRLDGFVAGLKREADRGADLEAGARLLAERLALALQGSLLLRHAPSSVADAFCATRLAGEGGRAYGAWPPGIDAAGIVDRHRPGPD